MTVHDRITYRTGSVWAVADVEPTASGIIAPVDMRADRGDTRSWWDTASDVTPADIIMASPQSIIHPMVPKYTARPLGLYWWPIHSMFRA